jgi:hypothetical protein
MDIKYKIEIVEGCTAFDTRVNDRSLMDISDPEKQEIIDYLLFQVKEAYNRNELSFDNIVQLFQPDDWEHDPYVCEQCGDTVSTTIWKL